MNATFKDIKTIFLDIDDTLFDFKAGQKVAFFKAFESLGYDCNEDIYRSYDVLNESYWKMFERGEITKERLIWERFEKLFEVLNINGSAYQAELAYQDLLGKQAIWIDGAEDGLKYLINKYDVYLTTNGYGATQRSRTQEKGIDKLVKDIYISEVIGSPKPTKKYFDFCVNSANASRERTVVIGDSLSSDMMGGINASMRTIWFNYRRLPKTDLPVDFTVNTWREIYDIL